MNNTVFVQAVPTYDAQLLDTAVETLFSQLDAPKRICGDSRILIKPNLLAKHPPEQAVTTHPGVVKAVIEACLRRGARHIVVADSAGGVYHPGQMKALYQGCGLWDLQGNGVTLYTACQSQVMAYPQGQVAKTFDIINPALEADFIINLPKCKSHVMTAMTGACKNMFGIVPGLKKSQWHMRFPDKERFGHMLMDLLEAVPPDMAIMDGILAMEGDGPGGGIPREVGVLLASENMVAMDWAVCQMMGLAPLRVPYLQAAHQRYGAIEWTLEGDPLPQIADWKLPRSYQGSGEGYVDFADHLPKVFGPVVRRVEQIIAPRPVVDKALCIGCGKCKEICPQNTIVVEKNLAKIVAKNCIRCFCCHEVCPVKAIDVKSRKIFQW